MNKSIIIAIILLVSSCSGRKGSTANEIEVDLSVNIDNIETRKLNLSEIASEFKTVLLETSEAALLNKPTEFAINDEYILIVDRDQKPAKLFTTTGEYIRDIGDIGVGPDEYL
ncbi:MAG: 6-bladed beta-propeller, partial [Bacteroidales bacterium]